MVGASVWVRPMRERPGSVGLYALRDYRVPVATRPVRGATSPECSLSPKASSRRDG